MLVDLATGGWRPEPLERGVWLFPPEQGAFDWSAVEDDGDGASALDHWHVAGQADKEKIVVDVDRDRSASAVERPLKLLLPPHEVRPLVVTGRTSRPVEDRGRRGVEVTV